MSNEETSKIKLIEICAKDILHFLKKEFKDTSLILAASKQEERDSNKHDMNAEFKDSRHIEYEISL